MEKCDAIHKLEKNIETLKREIQAIKDMSRIFQDNLEKREIDDVKCLSKITGLPNKFKNFGDLSQCAELKDVLKGAVACEVWARTTGETMGIATLRFDSVKSRQTAQQICKANKLKLEGSDIYMNCIKTPTQEKKDEPLVTAHRELKKAWEGTKDSLKMRLKERAIEVQGVTIVSQKEGELTINWRIPKEEAVTEEKVRAALPKSNS